MNVESLALETVLLGSARGAVTARYALEAKPGRNVHDYREIGRKPSDSDVLELFKECRLNATLALIDAGGIDEPVAQHPLAGRQRGLDGFRDMVGAGCGKEDGLGFRAQRLCRAREQHVTHSLRTRRSAGLACGHDVDAAAPQIVCEPGDLGRLAGPLAAFEGDELSSQDRFLEAWPTL